MVHHQIGSFEKVTAQRWGLTGGGDEQVPDGIIEDPNSVGIDINSRDDKLIIRYGD